MGIRESFAHKLDSDSVINDRWEFDETFHNAADERQLSRHVKQTVEYIDLLPPTTLLRTSQPTLTALHARENHPHVLLFARKLDYFIRSSFFTGNWSPTSLQKAIEKLKEENALCFYWKELLQKLNISSSQIISSCQVPSTCVHLFVNSQREGVLHIWQKMGLHPNMKRMSLQLDKC